MKREEKNKIIGEHIYNDVKNDLRFDLGDLTSLTISFKDGKNIELIFDQDGYCKDVNLGERKLTNLDSIFEKLLAGLTFVGDTFETIVKYQPYDIITSLTLKLANKTLTIAIEQF